jgi:PTH1 family peptidyl-tRNA hydrolase
MILLKPLTFMNLSGRAVKFAVDYYNFKDYTKLLVISDDINLPFGSIRLRGSGSAGGQKGMKSIIDSLSTNDFPRLRIGVGMPPYDTADYVLSSFSKTEKEILPKILDWAIDALDSFVLHGLKTTMSKFNKNILEN